jgi:hypothetical protein
MLAKPPRLLNRDNLASFRQTIQLLDCSEIVQLIRAANDTSSHVQPRSAIAPIPPGLLAVISAP